MMWPFRKPRLVRLFAAYAPGIEAEAERLAGAPLSTLPRYAVPGWLDRARQSLGLADAYVFRDAP